MTLLSVVVPAFNERARIVSLLGRLRDLGESAEVVVVCNGCIDGTADAARQFAPWAQVVELPAASKPGALRRGDELVTTMPRLYLDADVVVDADGIRAMVSALADDSRLLAVAATPRYEFDGASWLVRSYYRSWSTIQRSSSALSGTGAILVSAAGRERFTTWPDLIGDDHFVNGLFAADERARVAGAVVAVELPTRFADCVSRRARVLQGNRDVDAAAGSRPVAPPAGRSRSRQMLGALRASPALIADVPAHVVVAVASRVLAGWRRRRGTHRQFHRGRGR